MAAVGRPEAFRRDAAGARHGGRPAGPWRACADQPFVAERCRLSASARPDRQGRPGLCGGDQARRAAGRGAWIDVAENNDLAKPSGLIRPKDCAGVDKSLRFKTSGGPLSIQISGSYAKTIKVEAVRAD
jgi:hypothetical protein